MVDQHAGVNPKVNFSSFDKHMTLRTDGDKDTCRIHNLKVLSKEAFFQCCKARQNANTKHRHTSNQLKSFDCEACKCGIEIMTGRKKNLPKNVELLK